MNIFGNYQGAQIVRKAYWSGVDKKIEMYPIRVRVCIYIVRIRVYE